MILVIDNYDSFTYNLVQYLGELGADPVVRRNDAVTVDEIAALAPAAIVLSPGPGTPDDAGVTLDLIKAHGATKPILGVCLGHQAIGVAYGGRVVRAATLMHGKTSSIEHSGEGIFRSLASPLRVMRYHSLTIEPASLPPVLEVTAWSHGGEIQAIRHRVNRVFGVQFHPESILTEQGRELLRNFLVLAQ